MALFCYGTLWNVGDIVLLGLPLVSGGAGR